MESNRKHDRPGKPIAYRGLLEKKVPPPSTEAVELRTGEWRPIYERLSGSSAGNSKPTLVLFWTKWCRASIQLMNHLTRYAEENAQDVCCLPSKYTTSFKRRNNGWRPNNVVSTSKRRRVLKWRIEQNSSSQVKRDIWSTRLARPVFSSPFMRVRTKPGCTSYSQTVVRQSIRVELDRRAIWRCWCPRYHGDQQRRYYFIHLFASF